MVALVAGCLPDTKDSMIFTVIFMSLVHSFFYMLVLFIYLYIQRDPY